MKHDSQPQYTNIQKTENPVSKPNYPTLYLIPTKRPQ